jgi:hypothetical protein
VSEPLPHDRLMRELETIWREGRRAALAAAGIEVRRPTRAWPEPPEPPTSAALLVGAWADAVVDVATLHAGGIENVTLTDLVALTDEFLATASLDEALPLLELDPQRLEEALRDALADRGR